MYFLRKPVLLSLLVASGEIWATTTDSPHLQVANGPTYDTTNSTSTDRPETEPNSNWIDSKLGPYEFFGNSITITNLSAIIIGCALFMGAFLATYICCRCMDVKVGKQRKRAREAEAELNELRENYCRRLPRTNYPVARYSAPGEAPGPFL